MPMIDFTPEGAGIAVSVPSEHGLLHGQLDLVRDAPGIVVLAHAALALDNRDALMAKRLRESGLSTLSVDLLARQEEHFPDVHNNIPLLAKRLLDFMGLLKNRMLLGELQLQAVGLCAANTTSPVVVRVAALRDHDVAAIVCRGGLIDLAGILYLRSLESPVLVLNEASDETHAASSRRALQEVHGEKALLSIPDIDVDYAVSEGFDVAAQEAAKWFTHWFSRYEVN